MSKKKGNKKNEDFDDDFDSKPKLTSKEGNDITSKPPQSKSKKGKGNKDGDWSDDESTVSKSKKPADVDGINTKLTAKSKAKKVKGKGKKGDDWSDDESSVAKKPVDIAEDNKSKKKNKKGKICYIMLNNRANQGIITISLGLSRRASDTVASTPL